jgi:hypothetical protein
LDRSFIPGDRVRIKETGEVAVIDGDYGPRFHPRYSTVGGSMHDAAELEFLSHHAPASGAVSPAVSRARQEAAARHLRVACGRDDATPDGPWDTDGPHRLIRAIRQGGLRAQFTAVFVPGRPELESASVGDWHRG